jgi:hypothetical protein
LQNLNSNFFFKSQKEELSKLNNRKNPARLGVPNKNLDISTFLTNKN